ncbi:flagellar type III secretion system pore protein FliP [Nocardioides kribbensis]|uniref:flagellar type III secretion system pore protein FliP n=1 Tax=Nocardioides kribbensis TaxID=305517 RepID=UPI0029D41A1B|nr:flagellar type III secretion system pore protein FliP [Nocardioides kribbensis]
MTAARLGRATRAPRRVGALVAAALVTGLVTLAATAVLLLGASAPASATDLAPAPTAPASPAPTAGATDPAPAGTGAQRPGAGPTGPAGPTADPGGDVTIDFTGLTDKPSSSVTLLVTLTLLSLAPAILLTCTSFTKILIVLGLTRNALGLQQTPPNQVLAGLALFLSLFIMTPTLSAMNDAGVQPYLDGDKTSAQSFEDGIEPLREFMLDQTGDEELRLLTNVARRDLPDNRDDVGMTTLVPAFILSELKAAFIIGFIIFIPFLVIDIVVSGALMALGMMMMPPVMVSLPFKLLLFVLVDGWALVIKALVSSYGTT